MAAAGWPDNQKASRASKTAPSSRPLLASRVEVTRRPVSAGAAYVLSFQSQNWLLHSAW
jgi:hypothetical protein